MSSLATALLRLVPILGAVLLSVGCVLPDQMSRLQKDVADVRQQILTLEREQRDTRDLLSGIEQAMQSGGGADRSEFADLEVQLEQVRRDVGTLDERLNDAQRRMDRLSEDVLRNRELTRRLSAAATAPAQGEPGSDEIPDEPGDAPSGADPLPDPDALYNAAYADFSKGNYALAISGFQEYASRFSDSNLADNALYWVGECEFSQGNFRRAVEAFDRMLEGYPDSDRAAPANLKKGLAFLEENEVRQAIVQLRYVVAAYPTTDEAKIARDKLASLGAPVR